MNRVGCWIAVLSFSVLTACGESGTEKESLAHDSSPPVGQPDLPAPEVEPARSTDVGLNAGQNPATQVAQEAARTADAGANSSASFPGRLARPDCRLPVDVSQYPTPEVAGVRLGMPRMEAFAVVFCSGRQDYQAYGESNPLVVNAFGAEQTMAAQRITVQNSRAQVPETESVTLVAPGFPGEELLGVVYHYQRYPVDERPTVESVVSQLVETYGEPTRRNNLTGEALVSWYWDLDGTQMTNQQAVRCQSGSPGSSRLSANAPLSHCGLTLQASVLFARADRNLADGLSIGMSHQKTMADMREMLQGHFRELNAAPTQ